MVVLGTVILNATGAGIVAKMLGVMLEKSNGILMVGAHRASRLIAKYLKDNGKHVVLIDSNHGNIDKANELGLDAHVADIYKDELKNNADFNDIGVLMAMTGSAEVNDYSLTNLSRNFGENGSYRLTSVNELQNPETATTESLFSKHDDFINLLEVARDYPAIHEIPISSNEHLEELLEKINTEEKAIPLFVKKTENNDFVVIKSMNNNITISEGDALSYMGKAIIEPTNEVETVTAQH